VKPTFRPKCPSLRLSTPPPAHPASSGAGGHLKEQMPDTARSKRGRITPHQREMSEVHGGRPIMRPAAPGIRSLIGSAPAIIAA
jgi:hypothetical protein